MATSGTRTFTLTAADAIEEAYELAGLEYRTGYDGVTARRSMNIMFADWSNRGVQLWEVEQVSLDLVQGTTVSSYSSFAQILLVDTISFSDSYPANFIPTSSQLSTLQSAQAPEGYATSDWTNNAVLVILNGFHNYVPGANSPDLDIQISGSAMLADNNQSEEFNFSIQDLST